MKKIHILLVMLGLLACLTACKKDFLNQEKPLSMTESVIFADPGYIQSNLLGCYYIFKGSNPTFMGGLGFVVFDSRGDDIVNVSNPQTMQETYEMVVLGTSLENTKIWKQSYSTINECNIFIDNLAKYECDKVLGAELCAQYVAEAKFIRAYCYYVLANLYSQPYCVNPQATAVPLRIKGLTSSGNNDCPASTIAQIYGQILEDCIPDALPSGVAGTVNGVTRANNAAAHLLKMRVYMAMEQWDNAINEGLAITGYGLEGDVTKLYGTDIHENQEIIFAMPMSNQDKPNTQMSASEYFDVQASVSWIDAESGILSVPGYCLAKDKRIRDLVTDPDGNGYRFTKKFTAYGSHLDWLPLMRYAEVKLNLAECYVNKADGTTNAKTYLKDVRSRSIAPADDVFSVDALSGGDLKTAVYNERRLEFLCEGIRGIDIMRRGESFVKNNSFMQISVAPGTTGYTWPIPDTEKTYNKALK